MNDREKAVMRVKKLNTVIDQLLPEHGRMRTELEDAHDAHSAAAVEVKRLRRAIWGQPKKAVLPADLKLSIEKSYEKERLWALVVVKEGAYRRSGLTLRSARETQAQLVDEFDITVEDMS